MRMEPQEPGKSGSRIPFNVSVECGLDAVCFVRNLSRTGIYLETAKSEEALKILPGMKITLRIPPSDAPSSVQIIGKVAQVWHTQLEDETPALGIGVEFEPLPDETATELKQYVRGYRDRKRAESSVRENQFSKSFLPESLYAEYARSKTFPEGIQKDVREELHFLLLRWHNRVREHPGIPTDAQSLLERARALALKIFFEARRVCALRPVRRDLLWIEPAYQDVLASASAVCDELRKRRESAWKEEEREQLLCFERAQAHLADAIREFETFLGSLPETEEDAKRFYERSPLGVIEIQEGTSAPKRRRLEFSAGWVISTILIASGSGLIGYHWNKIKGFQIGSSAGRPFENELGISPYRVEDDIWIGRVDLSEWKKTAPKIRWRKGNELLKEVIEHGYEGLRVESSQGTPLGVTVMRDRKPELYLLRTP